MFILSFQHIKSGVINNFTQKNPCMFFFFVISLQFFSIVFSIKPLKTLTNDLILEFTLNNKISLEYFFIDDTNNGEETHFIYTTTQINKQIQYAKIKYNKLLHLYSLFLSSSSSSSPSSSPPSSSNQNNDNSFLNTLHKKDWLYYLLIKYQLNIINKRVGVIGSTDPWIETLVLALDAEEVTTIEYNKLTYGENFSKIRTISYSEFDDFYNNSKGYFDIIFSISSFDHDGLGRYGDPINPYSDLESIARIRCLLKPGGILFLGVPFAPDTIVYNLHRIYGKYRIALLLLGWDLIDVIREDCVVNDPTLYGVYNCQPLLVLQKPRLKLGRNKIS